MATWKNDLEYNVNTIARAYHHTTSSDVNDQSPGYHGPVRPKHNRSTGLKRPPLRATHYEWQFPYSSLLHRSSSLYFCNILKMNIDSIPLASTKPKWISPVGLLARTVHLASKSRWHRNQCFHPPSAGALSEASKDKFTLNCLESSHFAAEIPKFLTPLSYRLLYKPTDPAL